MTARPVRFFSCWISLILIAIVPAHAKETIRVALSTAATTVRVSADRSLRLAWPSGRRVTSQRPVIIRWSPNGAIVNDDVRSLSPLHLSTAASELTIALHDAADRTTRSWTVHGELVIRYEGAGLLVVNHVPLERYVAGVVAGEINPRWHPEALKAQAVAARTYVLYKALQHAADAYDVVASVQDQVYHGRRHINGAVRRAVAETKGLIVTYERRPIYAAYSSTAAGLTEDALYVWALDLPYLKGVDCPFDETSPRYTWEATVPVSLLEHRLRDAGYQVGVIGTLTPFSFTPSGRVDRLRILHSDGELILTGQDLRRAVGYTEILSTQFTVQRLDRALVLSGKGAGHGVGLCQWGMKEMAELGYRYDAILRYFYPGTRLLPLNQARLAD